jgi:hypothetical protein
MRGLGKHTEVLRRDSASPKWVAGDALYLDFDGVLHHHDVRVSAKSGIHFGPEAVSTGRVHALFEHQDILVDLLKPYDTVRIVLSTTWARTEGFDRARNRLCEALATRVVGSTFHSGCDRQAFKQASRGAQVWGDVHRRHPRRWLAVDDDFFGWPAWCVDRLVVSDPVLGLSSAKTATNLAQKLRDTFT